MYHTLLYFLFLETPGIREGRGRGKGGREGKVQNHIDDFFFDRGKKKKKGWSFLRLNNYK